MGTTVAAMVCVADCAKTSPSHFLERSKGTVKADWPDLLIGATATHDTSHSFAYVVEHVSGEEILDSEIIRVLDVTGRRHPYVSVMKSFDHGVQSIYCALQF